MEVKRICAAYWSATGNTDKTVNTIAETLAEKLGVPLERRNFTRPSDRAEDLSFTGGDLVVFGMPTYAGKLPNKMLPYVQQQIHGNGALAVGVVTFGNRSYDNSLAELCAVLEAPFTLAPGQRALLPTGFAIELPGPEYVALIFARSSLGSKHGVALPNGVGVIDSDYRGEVHVALANHGQQPYVIQPGERVAQMAVVPVARAVLQEVDELGGTARGEGGFGSTGKL